MIFNVGCYSLFLPFIYIYDNNNILIINYFFTVYRKIIICNNNNIDNRKRKTKRGQMGQKLPSV